MSKQQVVRTREKTSKTDYFTHYDYLEEDNEKNKLACYKFDNL